jgi:Protein  of unknown function (DUF3018)
MPAKAKSTPRSKAKPKARTSRDKVRSFRQRQRAKGMRLLQIWVPDVTAPGFKAEAHRQSLLAANSPQEAEDQAFVDSLVDWDD